MSSIKKYFEDKKEQCRRNHEDFLRENFDVTERGGYLWLTYNGVAFMKVSATSNASDVTDTLNQARDCAVEFERI